MRIILAVITDTHGGHIAGLLNPETVLQRKQENEDGGYDLVDWTPPMEPGQLRRWSLYERIIESAINLARGDQIILISLGDHTQGILHSDDALSMRVADHVLIAKWNFMPWMTIPNVVETRLISGTSWHEFGEGSAMILVADALRDKFPNKNITPLYHGLTDIRQSTDVEGVLVDYTHHGPSQSMRKHLEGNTARYYLQSSMQDELMDGKTPPHLVLRGHFHSMINEVITRHTMRGWFESRIVVCPPLCGLGDYARKTTRSAHKITEGGVLFEILDNKPQQPVFITDTRDIRKKEVLYVK